jgi:mono/diheme cytochrome c family protein
MESDNLPIHPNPNMDWQARYNAQEQSDFFDDDMTMRPPVPGTVAKGFLREDTRLYTGRTEDGQYVDEVPVPVTQALLERGRERFNIFCSVCHGQAGFGQGVIMTGDYGYTPAPSYHQSTLRDTADGYIYEVITNGVRNMPGYAQQVPVADRWAIVAYIRALQRSQNAQRENIPPSVLARIEQTGSANMNAARNPASSGGGGGTGGGGGATTSGQGGSREETAGESGEEAEDAGSSSNAAPADTAATEPTAATQDTTPPQTAPEGAAAPSADTAATATADTAAAGAPGGEASMDTTSQQTTVAENANAASPDTAGGASGTTAGASEDEGGGFFGSMFSILLLVVLPIAVLCGVLIVAFRKDREH